MSIKDVLASLASSNLLDNVQAITAFDMTVSMILALGMGMFIFLIYRRIYQGPMFSGTFGVSLVALSMISTVLILAVTSNVVLSLGMVGALSIVRFRTAVKDPLEIVFLFWSIETGIVLATGIFTLAVVVNVAIGCVLLLLVRDVPCSRLQPESCKRNQKEIFKRRERRVGVLFARNFLSIFSFFIFFI